MLVKNIMTYDSVKNSSYAFKHGQNSIELKSSVSELNDEKRSKSSTGESTKSKRNFIIGIVSTIALAIGVILMIKKGNIKKSAKLDEKNQSKNKKNIKNKDRIKTRFKAWLKRKKISKSSEETVRKPEQKAQPKVEQPKQEVRKPEQKAQPKVEQLDDLNDKTKAKNVRESDIKPIFEYHNNGAVNRAIYKDSAGNLQEIAVYRNDNVKLEHVYYQNGRIIKLEAFGEASGNKAKEIIFKENVKIKEIIYKKDGITKSEELLFDQIGRIKQIKKYGNNGHLNSNVFYDEKGNITKIEIYSIKDDVLMSEELYEKGFVRQIKNYRDDGTLDYVDYYKARRKDSKIDKYISVGFICDIPALSNVHIALPTCSHLIVSAADNIILNAPCS